MIDTNISISVSVCISVEVDVLLAAVSSSRLLPVLYSQSHYYVCCTGLYCLSLYYRVHHTP